jgi:hypothetical protein
LGIEEDAAAPRRGLTAKQDQQHPSDAISSALAPAAFLAIHKTYWALCWEKNSSERRVNKTNQMAANHIVIPHICAF